MSTEVEHLDQERVDELIWRGAGVKSVRKIAEETGLKPEEVLRRKNELLEEVDPLTIQQTRQRLLIDLQRIARTAQEDYEKSPWETKSGLLNSAIAAMKQVFSEMNRLEKQDNEKITALNNLRKREVVNLYISVVDKGVQEISEAYDIPESDLFGVFNSLMREESARLEV